MCLMQAIGGKDAAWQRPVFPESALNDVENGKLFEPIS
jgi:hypothetical protein